MIIVLKPDHDEEDLHRIIRRLEDLGLRAHISKGEHRTIVGAIGDERVLREVPIESLPGVESVLPILKPYKLVSREFKRENTVINVNGRQIGGEHIHVFAGPCAVESREVLEEIAESLLPSGVCFLRGGAFKPRTSPYSFQGWGEKALKFLAGVRDRTEHAELQAAHRSGEYRQAGHSQAGIVFDHQGIPHVCRIHPGSGQRKGDPV